MDQHAFRDGCKKETSEDNADIGPVSACIGEECGEPVAEYQPVHCDQEAVGEVADGVEDVREGKGRPPLRARPGVQRSRKIFRAFLIIAVLETQRVHHRAGREPHHGPNSKIIKEARRMHARLGRKSCRHL